MLKIVISPNIAPNPATSAVRKGYSKERVRKNAIAKGVEKPKENAYPARKIPKNPK